MDGENEIVKYSQRKTNSEEETDKDNRLLKLDKFG